MIQKEANQETDDRLLTHAINKRNEIENFIYSTRNKLEHELAGYISNEDKEKLLALMKEMEEWLYSGDEEVYNKNTLEQKGKSLDEAGTKLFKRIGDWEKLNEALQTAESNLQKHLEKLHEERGKLGKDSALSQAEHDEISKIFENYQVLVAEALSRTQGVPKFMDPLHDPQELNKQIKDYNEVTIHSYFILENTKRIFECRKKAERASEAD